MPSINVSPAHRIKTFNVLATGVWLNLAPCNPKNNEVIEQFVKDKFNLQEGVSDVTVACDVFNMDNNFVYYDDAQYFRSPDENHMISCGSKKMIPPSSELITMIAGTIPAGADSRYSSISLVDLFPPGKNVYTVSDQALRQFYKSQGQSAVNYTIIMAKSKTVLNRCGLTKLPSNWYQVYWGGMTDAATSSYPGIVYREIETNGYEESLEQTRYACQSEKECSNPKFFEAHMKEFYPRISYLTCNSDGSISPAPGKNVTFADPSLGTRKSICLSLSIYTYAFYPFELTYLMSSFFSLFTAAVGIWENLLAQDALGVSGVPQVNVNVSSFAGSEVYVAGALAGKATDGVKVS